MAAAKARIRASKRLMNELRERDASLTDMLENPDYSHLAEIHGSEWELARKEVWFQIDLAEAGLPDNEIAEDLAIWHESHRS